MLFNGMLVTSLLSQAPYTVWLQTQSMQSWALLAMALQPFVFPAVYHMWVYRSAEARAACLKASSQVGSEVPVWTPSHHSERSAGAEIALLQSRFLCLGHFKKGLGSDHRQP